MATPPEPLHSKALFWDYLPRGDKGGNELRFGWRPCGFSLRTLLNATTLVALIPWLVCYTVR